MTLVKTEQRWEWERFVIRGFPHFKHLLMSMVALRRGLGSPWLRGGAGRVGLSLEERFRRMKDPTGMTGMAGGKKEEVADAEGMHLLEVDEVEEEGGICSDECIFKTYITLFS